MKYRKIYILHDNTDAKFFLGSNERHQVVLTLTPNAYYPVKDTDNKIIRSSEEFGNNEHEYIVEKLHGLEEVILTKLENNHFISKISKELIFNRLHIYLALCFRVWLTIPKSDAYNIFENGNLIQYENRKSAYLSILKKIRSSYMPHTIEESVFSPLINKLNLLSAKLVKSKNLFVFSSFDYGFSWMAKEILDKDSSAKFILFSTSKADGFDLFRSLKTFIAAIFSIKKIKFIVAPISRNNKDQYEGVFASIDDTNIKQGLDLFTDNIYKNALVADEVSSRIIEYFGILKPKAFVAHQLKSPTVIAVAQAAKKTEIPSYLASHGTHIFCKNQFANFEQKSLARGILASHLVEYNVIQSKLAKQAVEKFFPNLNYLTFDQINLGFPYYRKKNSMKNNHMQILHASTYKAFSSWRPWVFETSDEFYNSLIALIDVVNQMDSVDLTIRHRENIGEISMDTFVGYIASSSRISVKTDQDGTFLEDLQSADLVISNSSTTIEEAMMKGKYVILWGEGHRYSHVDNELLDEQLIFPVYSKYELYNTIEYLKDHLMKQPRNNLLDNNCPNRSQQNFIKRLLS